MAFNNFEIKEFGPDGAKVNETVASAPSVSEYRPEGVMPGKGLYCLRMDADEYTPGSFSEYYGLFEKYKKAMTIFFNVNSFREAKSEIKRCYETGIDVQSHAFYHYTYNDYRSNRYNIKKAKDFLSDMGIDTVGFASPMGKWNACLMEALEDEGYRYSSDFSYDYFGFPSYPMIRGKKCGVLEIPIFSVAPELFFLPQKISVEAIAQYFMKAVDELASRGIPVILYGHTDPKMPEIPFILEAVTDYAINGKELKPVSMTDIFREWEYKAPEGSVQRILHGDVPPSGFIGRKVRQAAPGVIKKWIKDTIDFERITPPDEIKCNFLKKMVKLLARKIL